MESSLREEEKQATRERGGATERAEEQQERESEKLQKAKVRGGEDQVNELIEVEGFGAALIHLHHTVPVSVSRPSTGLKSSEEGDAGRW